MASVDRYDAAYNVFISRYVRNNLHTNIRGKVVGVDYSGPSVDVQPMTYTQFPSGTKDSYPVIYDVPILLPSGANGKARLTMPIKVGDIVGLSFSERNESDVMDMNTHQLFPGWAVTQIFTDGNRKPIDPNNVVLENDKAVMVYKPDGTMTFKNPSVNIEAKPNGQVFVNGCEITPDGNVITGAGVNLNEFWQKYVSHTHPGVQSGGSSTQPTTQV
ncbi:putative baseplate assembly protein [Salmonella phage SSBI34]|nr:putative baseplate assembly protein [Salmonella phage SSBI34]